MIASGIANAVITYLGNVRGANDAGIDVFAFQAGSERIVFPVRWIFERNGYDFVAEIGAFDPGEKLSAIPGWNRTFQPHQAEDAKHRLEQYFLGDEVKAFPPFSVTGANLVGVQFADDWAAVEAR
jgi:hypothetical protein